MKSWKSALKRGAAVAAFSSLMATAPLFPSTVEAQESPSSRVMFVFDASNSMWGQIDGTAKIEIARQSFMQALQSTPLGAETGLMVYGHRRRGDCSDIELVQPMARGGAAMAQMSRVINEIKPTGKTPLTEAVRQAADAMKYQEVPSTVVLVTDGIESCNADPCALATELERLGVDFTAHVVGFGLSQQDRAAVQCIADETGGMYFDAQNANGLSDALNQVVQIQPEPVPVPEPEPEVSPLPQLLAVRVLTAESSTKPLRVDAVGRPGVKSAIASIVGPDGVPIRDVSTTLAPTDIQRQWGIPVNDSWSTQFSPTQHGTHILRLAFDGFEHDVPFEVTPGMPPFLDVAPDLTLLETKMVKPDGTYVEKNFVNAAFCPSARVWWDEEPTGCFSSEDHTRLVPPGDYSVFTWRTYRGSTRGIARLSVGPGGVKQTIEVPVGEELTDLLGDASASTTDPTPAPAPNPVNPSGDVIALAETGQVDAAIRWGIPSGFGELDPPPGDIDPNRMNEGVGGDGYTLGCGGFATFRFDNNTLANGPGPDLDIEERGGSEAFLVQVSKDGDNWVD
ncbi:MAG: VWA domain-containing protein, partial [Pseudomonadota bacterium]